MRIPALIFHIITIIRYHNARVYLDIKNMKHAKRVMLTNLLAHALSNLYGSVLSYFVALHQQSLTLMSFTKHVVFEIITGIMDFLTQILGFTADKIYDLTKPIRTLAQKLVEKSVKLIQMKSNALVVSSS